MVFNTSDKHLPFVWELETDAAHKNHFRLYLIRF